jgi:hypothetical protein
LQVGGHLRHGRRDFLGAHAQLGQGRAVELGGVLPQGLIAPLAYVVKNLTDTLLYLTGFAGRGALLERRPLSRNGIVKDLHFF